MNTINGVVPVIPIPFDEQENIDEPSLRRTVQWVAQQGLPAMCLPAYGSEFYKLSEAERERVVALAIEASDGRIPVIAQANHASAKIAAATAQRYERLGANRLVNRAAMPKPTTCSAHSCRSSTSRCRISKSSCRSKSVCSSGAACSAARICDH